MSSAITNNVNLSERGDRLTHCYPRLNGGFSFTLYSSKYVF